MPCQFRRNKIRLFGVGRGISLGIEQVCQDSNIR